MFARLTADAVARTYRIEAKNRSINYLRVAITRAGPNVFGTMFRLQGTNRSYGIIVGGESTLSMRRAPAKGRASVSCEVPRNTNIHICGRPTCLSPG